MFRVNVMYTIEDDWDVKDEMLYRVAGRRSASSSATCDSKNPNKKIRDHVWYVDTIEEARIMRERLIAMGVIATLREA